MEVLDPHATAASTVCTEFIEGLAGRDWPRVRSLLDENLSFRVLTPHALRESSDAGGAMGWLMRWFGDADTIIALHSEVYPVQHRLALTYRFRVLMDTWYVIQQGGCVDVAGGRIANLSLVCSGFLPDGRASGPG